MTAKHADGRRVPPRPSSNEVAPELTRNYAEALLNASGDDVDAVIEELEAIVADVLRASPNSPRSWARRRSRSPRPRTGS